MSIDLDQLAALEQAATPWHDESLLRMLEEIPALRGADAALIVAMRNALPELIERVREAETNARVSEVGNAFGKVAVKERDYERHMRDKAEARVAHLEAGIKALADEWDDGYNLKYTAAWHLRALLNGTDKDGH